MADQRTDYQLDWEKKYLENVDRINQILYNEKVSIDRLTETFPVTPTPDNNNGLRSSSDVSPANIVAGNYTLPDTIKTAYISGGHVIIPTGSRTPYHQVRDLAAQASKYAGFQSINEDLFTFPDCPEENYFAPDFIPILILMHSQIAPALGIDKIILNSGTRKKPIDVKWDSHMGGYAVDMRLYKDDRYTAADICWELGLRGVAVANGFVHVDAGPDPVSGWGYPSVPIYRGPGSPKG